MATLSKGITISPQERMTELEIAHTIALIFNKTELAIPSAFGYGIPFAFGTSYIVHEKESNRPVIISKQLDQQINDALSSKEYVKAFFTLELDENQNLETVQAYENNLAAINIRAEKFRAIVRANQANDKTFHKRACAFWLTVRMQQELTSALKVYGKQFNDFLGLGQDQLMAFWEKVPTSDVEIELTVERNKNWDRKIHKNDATDMAFLNVAIPYCDIVVTERFFAMSAIKCNLDKKYNTVIIENLTDLQLFL